NQALDAPLVLHHQHLERARIALLRTLDQRPIGIGRAHLGVLSPAPGSRPTAPGANKVARSGCHASPARCRPALTQRTAPCCDRSTSSIQLPRSSLGWTVASRSMPPSTHVQWPCCQRTKYRSLRAALHPMQAPMVAATGTTASHGHVPRPAGPAAASTCDQTQAANAAATAAAN